LTVTPEISFTFTFFVRSPTPQLIVNC